MNTKDEALKMAINWFEGGDFYYPEELLNACKEALEQPAQEPVAWIDEFGVIIRKLPIPIEGITGTKFIPLYTHPHQWQGLTDDEIRKLTFDGFLDEYDKVFANAIEAKLKEKNYV